MPNRTLAYTLQALLIGLSLGLVSVSMLSGQSPVSDAGCQTSDFSGQYAIQVLAFDIASTPAAPRSVAGSITADGEGKIVAEMDWMHRVGPDSPPKLVITNDLVAFAEAAGSEMTYSVEPDCRMTMMADVQTPGGMMPLLFQGALANGGREALLQAGSESLIGTFTAKRTDAFDAKQDERIEAISEQIETIKALLDRMAFRLGIVP